MDIYIQIVVAYHAFLAICKQLEPTMWASYVVTWRIIPRIVITEWGHTNKGMQATYIVWENNRIVYLMIITMDTSMVPMWKSNRFYLWRNFDPSDRHTQRDGFLKKKQAGMESSVEQHIENRSARCLSFSVYTI